MCALRNLWLPVSTHQRGARAVLLRRQDVGDDVAAGTVGSGVAVVFAGVGLGGEAVFEGDGLGVALVFVADGVGDEERVDDVLDEPEPDPLPEDPFDEPWDEELFAEPPPEIGPQNTLSGSTWRGALGARGSSGEQVFAASA
jgi:hypothetical protein